MLERVRYLVFGGGRTDGERRWPTPSTDWDEDDEPVRDIDHTDDDPGPDVLPGIELRPLDSVSE
jgi:hypothetical protein